MPSKNSMSPMSPMSPMSDMQGPAVGLDEEALE
jgi:hypothetical protein